jgi:hypothetical protein
LVEFALQPCDRMEFPKWFNNLAVIGHGGLAGLHGFHGETPPPLFPPKKSLNHYRHARDRRRGEGL